MTLFNVRLGQWYSSPRVFHGVEEAKDDPGEAEAGAERSHIQPMREIQTALDQLTELILEDLYAERASTQNTAIMLGITLEMRDLYRELERASAW